MAKTYQIDFIGDCPVTIEEGQSILQASLAAGIPHYHECGGMAKCSTCRIFVKEGRECLSDYNEKERLLRSVLPLPPNVRLACQTYVTGEQVAVHRLIRDDSDIELYIDDDKHVAQPIGEEKDMALFFLDIRNFTPFMESCLAFDVIHTLRKLFRLFRNGIESNGGAILETEGDGFYAVFGLHSDVRIATVGAVEAGFSILKELDLFNQQYRLDYFDHIFRVGIGVHAGTVITGNVGLGVNNNLTVMGLPVNIASRLQAKTKELNNDFVVSDYVMDLWKGPAAGTAEVNLKGLRSAFKVHLLGRPYS
jgi:adenylate cyclase